MIKDQMMISLKSGPTMNLISKFSQLLAP